MILVTRPRPQGLALCEWLTAHGYDAISFPTIAFAPPTDLHAFHQAIKLLGEQDWLIFVSPQSVVASAAAIRKAWPVLPPQAQCAAIGAGTAKALEEAGFMVALYPKQWDSEGLLALPAFQSIHRQKIALIRGEGGRDLLTQTFTARGAKILQVIAYQRVLPRVEIDNYQYLLAHRQITVVICTSFESVRNLQCLLGDKVNTIPLIVISERIKRLAHDLGFQTIWVAQNASHHAILEVLIKMRT